MGKPRLRGFALLKFLPDRAQLLPLIGRKQAVEAVCRLFLALTLSGQSLRVVGVGVAGVDFDHVVDEQHGHRFQHVDCLIGVFAEQNAHQRHMPCMVGVVFMLRAVGEQRLAQDGFLLVRLQNKVELLFESFRFHSYLSY